MSFIEVIITPNFWINFIVELFSYPYAWPGLTILFGLFLLFIIRLFRQKFFHLSKNDNSGQVSLSETALKSLVQIACIQQKILDRPKIKITQKRGLLHLQIKIKATLYQNISHISQELQNEIRIILLRHLNIENIGKIDVCIVAIKNTGKPIEDDSASILDKMEL